MKKSKQWTKEEDDIIKKYYSKKEATELVHYLPNRSVASIRTRMKRLNVGAVKVFRWTKEENENLKSLYSKRHLTKEDFEQEYKNLLPKRTLRAIRYRACKLHISSQR